MKQTLRTAALLAFAALWLGGKGYAATPETETAASDATTLNLDADADRRDKSEDEPRRKRNLGHLSGSFETNTIYYVKDKKTDAVVPHNHYGSNNWLKLDYQLDRFSAGIQLEYYPHPLVGTPAEGYEYVMEGFGWGNLAGKYLAWTDRNYSITVGDFYEQFGSGLILRAWEDRALGFNNSLGGARVTFNIGDIVSGKVLYAFPRFNMEYLSTQIGGADLSLSLSNAIGLRDHQLSIEGSVVNRHFKNLPNYWYDNGGEEVYGFDLSKNVLSYSGRINYEYNGWLAKFEYAGKGKDIFGEELKRGDAQLAEVGYTGNGFAVSAQFRRLKYMETKLYRPDEGSSSLGLLPGNTLNYIPALSPQHTYMLAGLDPNVSQPNGEMGFQIDAFYLFKRGTAIGGKRGLKIHANYARYYSLDGSTVLAPGTNFYYRDFSFDIDKSWNKRLRTVLFVSLQKHEMRGNAIRQNVFVADVTYKFTPKFSLRGELQYLYAPHTEGDPHVGGDWVAGLLEASFAPKWSIFVQDMYNHGSSEINYYMAGASFTHSFVRVALSYGRNRAGMICSGGVCREMPAYTGGNLALTLTF